MVERRRLDVVLVERGLVGSRAQAKELIAADRVTVDGAPAASPARRVARSENVEVIGPPPRFVSRAGAKLDGALDHFGLVVEGKVALDVGASTGGFTDCLLQRGARRVVAVDVGTGQLHQRLVSDPRVQDWSRTDIRHLDPARLASERPELVTADVSFISLRLVIPALVPLSAPDADWVLLVKPQFEAGRQEASRARGVIDDPAVWARTVAEVASATIEQGAGIMGIVPSGVRGTEGNVEFVLHARRGEQRAADSLDELIGRAIAGVAGVAR